MNWIKLLAFLGAAAFLCCRAGSSQALEPERADQQAFISRAVFAADRLWLLTDSGELSSLAEGDVARRREALPQPASDICVQGGDPIVIVGDRDGAGDWTLLRRSAGRWRQVQSFDLGGDAPHAFICDPSGMMLVTPHRLIELAPDGSIQRQIALKSAVSRPNFFGLITNAVRTDDGVYLGFDAGEWGGGLWRVDPKSGRFTEISRIDPGGSLCGGPLNTKCDQVNGLAHEPGKPDCLVATIGLEHMMSHGRLLEICGTQVRVLFSKPLAGGDAADQSVAFFGLAPVPGGGLIAAGNDGAYRIGADGAVSYARLPKFHAVDGVSVSFDLPDAVLVLTEINQRDSLSGAVPIVVPR